MFGPVFAGVSIVGPPIARLSIAGESVAWWLGFHGVVAALLVADGLATRTRREPGARRRLAWLATVAMALAAAGFAAWIAMAKGRQPALEFAAGYTIEVSLSIDNLFLFMVLFRGFGIGPERQHRALIWGVAGALVLRGAFIWAGVALLGRFEWVEWVFGIFLLYTAVRLARGSLATPAISASAGHGRTSGGQAAGGPLFPHWVRNLQPARGSLLPVILAVEFTDLLFATDSIPAVLAISHNPFVVYTSNVAAILALRSMYFALADLLGRLRYLHYALAAMLAFAGVKMIAACWIEVPVTISLAVMGGILGICAVASAIREPNRMAAG